MSRSIVDIKNMGDALRNTGYKNIESATAEIVDNSVDAQASNVFIILSEMVNTVSGRKQVSEIAFLDNGIGMDAEVLEGCLAIGSTTQGDRKGIGRFGVGLPQASLYACPEVEVYSWQNGIDNCQKVFLDIKKVKDGDQTELEDPIAQMVPEKYVPYLSYTTLDGQYDFKQSGTLVIWKNCDRVQPKTRGPLVERLEFALGQKFRYFIGKGICNIKIICDENQENAVDVYPNDPLFLMTNNYVLGDPAFPGKAYVKKAGATLEPYFERYFDPACAHFIDADGSVHWPVKYYDQNNKVAETEVLIRFSIVKSKFYDETAIAKGKNPGQTEFGQKYARKMEGISIIRADREIDFRQFDFYSNLDKPEHRWWGCEIVFDPILDEAFGVANNKQYVELKAIEPEDIDPDEVVQPMWCQLRSVIENTIKAMYARNKETRKETRTAEGTQTPTVEIINDVEGDNTDPVDSATKQAKENTPHDELISQGADTLVEQGVEDPTEEEVTRFINNSVNFRYVSLSRFGPAFDYSFKLGCALISVNTDHDFYTSFLEKLYESNAEAKTTFELFLASFVKAIDETHYQQAENDKLVAMWNDKLKRYILEQLNPRKSK